MAIFRGVGGSGDSSDNSFLQEVTAQANAAEQSKLGAQSALNFAISSANAASDSASSASASASSILNLTAATGDAGTDASYNASTGVLTIPRGNAGTDATVTTSTVEAVGAVMDGDFTSNGFMKRTSAGTYTVDTNTYLTSFTEANNLSTTVTWADVPDANITQTSVTQHQAALSITESQISNLQSYLTTHQDISGKANLSGATFTGDVTAESKLIVKKYPVASDLLTTSRSIQDLAAWSLYGGVASNYALTPEKYRDALDVNQDNRFSSDDSYAILLFASNNYTSGEFSTFQSLLNNPSNITSTFVQDVLDGDYDNDGVIIDGDASSVLTVEGDIDVTGSAQLSGGDLILRSDSTAADTQSIRFENDSSDDRTAYIRADYDASVGGNDISLVFGTTPGGEDGSDQMVLTKTGKVGIGTTSPASKLHIDTPDATALTIQRDSGASSNVSIKYDGASQDFYTGIASTSEDFVIGTSADLNGNNLLRVTSAGNVGIGTTSPNYEAHIHEATANADARIQLTNADTGTGTNDGFHIIMNGTTLSKQVNLLNREASPLALWTNNTERMRIDASGNVGIGTSNPNDKFHVANGSTGAGYLRIANNEGYARLGTDGGNLLLDVRGSEKMRIDSSGNVGIGTTSPSEALDVVGNANISGTITAPNVDISTTGTVTTNIATGGAGLSSATKTVNIGTGFNNYFGGLTTVNIGTQSVNNQNTVNIGSGVSVSSKEDTINLKGNVNVDGTVGALDATVASPSQNTPILKLRKNSPNADGTGRFITLASSTSSGGTEITRGFIGLSNTTAPQYSNPYMSHTSGSNGISCTYSSNSSFNAITPCASTGIPTNGSLNLGHAYAKWNTVYASSGSINTSDITKKQDIEELSEAESRVAIAAKGLLRKYRWKEAVAEKGDNARIHFGIMAQDLKAAFEAEGLDAHKYGMFCADTRWTTDGTDTYATEEEAPEAVTEETVYGVRYEELLAFIIAAL